MSANRDKGRGLGFQEVTTAADGADGEAERREPAPEPDDVDIEDVATGHPVGPAGPGEALAADDRLVAIEHRGGEPGLHGWERHPATAVAEQAALVELGVSTAAAAGPIRKDLHAQPDVLVGRRQADPVLQLIGRDRWADSFRDEDQPRGARRSYLVESVLVSRSADHLDVHDPGP